MTETKIIHIDLSELMVRMIEAGHQKARPSGQTPQQILNDIPNEDDEVDCLYRMAQAAVAYVIEQQSIALGPENISSLMGGSRPGGMN